MSQSQPFITIARVVKPQGRRGEVAAEILTDFPERFSQRKQLSALWPDRARRALTVEVAWFHKGRVILKFAGVDSITAAEELTGAELQVPLSERATPEPGSYFIGDLIGCRVTDVGSGERQQVGVLSEIRFGAGQAPLLVIADAGGKEYLVPFAEAYIQKVDLAGKTLDLQLPEGMLDLDKPLTREEKEEQGRH